MSQTNSAERTASDKDERAAARGGGLALAGCRPSIRAPLPRSPAIHTVALSKRFGNAVAVNSLVDDGGTRRGVRLPRPERSGEDDRGEAPARARRAPPGARRWCSARRWGTARLGGGSAISPSCFASRSLLTAREVLRLHCRLLGAARSRRGSRRGAAPCRPSVCSIAPTTESARSRRACNSGSGSAWRCSATRRWSSSTSRPAPSTPSGATTCARSSVSCASEERPCS